MAELLNKASRRSLGSAVLLAAALASASGARAIPLYAQQPVTAAARASTGWKAFEEGRLDEAFALLEQAVRLAPRDADYAAALGTVETKIGRQDAAIGHFKMAVLLKPSDPEFRLNLAELLQKKGNDQDALNTLHGTPSPALANAWHFTRGFSFFRMGRLVPATEQFKLVLQAPQFTAPASFFLGNIDYLQGEFVDAEPYLAKAVELGNVPDNRAYNVYTYDYGLLLFKLGKFAEAAQQFKASIAQYNADPLPWMFLGRCEEELGNYSEAIAMLETSTQKDATFQLADYELARLQQRHGDPARAAEIFKRIGTMKEEEVSKETERAMKLKTAPRPD